MTSKTKYIIIAVVVVLALAVGAFLYFTPAEAPGPDTTSSTTPGPSSTEPSVITMLQVSAHASVGSCWTVIRGNVYDLTSWISKHPGGQAAILGICGKDGTEKFTGKHGGSEPQESALSSFKIGALGQ